MNKIGLIIRDFVVFSIIIFITKIILSELRYEINVTRNTVEIIAVGFMFASTMIFTFFTNKKYLLSILYGLIIFVIILFLSDRRIFPNYWFLMLLIGAVSFIFHQIKTHKQENSLTKNIDKIDLSSYHKLGDFKTSINPNLFELKKELNVEKGSYKKFKPILLHKAINDNNDIVLNYSNKDDLNFVLLISTNVKFSY
ncbi:hypothetical protein [Maribacter sp. IgM3_T14_3]|uniref:hypothetical protein n=1 Tax=Maribacter sp. IgM3_T14_3 TaxID=3415140 RepID=UPI003C6F417F